MLTKDRRNDKKLILEDVRILPFSKNFAGEQKQFNPKGNRNFLVALDEEDAAALEDLGVTVKKLDPRNEDDDPLYFIKVKLNFKENEDGSWYPRIQVIPETRSFKRTITKLMAKSLDYADILSADLMITMSPYRLLDGRNGVTLWLNDAVFIIRENPFDVKYRDVPGSAISALYEDDDISEVTD